MKKILFAALIAAVCLSACKQQGEKKESGEAAETQAVIEGGDIAYVNVDKVFADSEMYKSEGVALKDKTEKAQKSWDKKAQNLQYEAAQLQEKYQKGLITTRDAQAKQEDLEKRAASHQTAVQKEAQTLDEENYVFSNRMNDLLMRSVQAINADKKYKLVINASALLDAQEGLDITDQVLAKFNELYAAEKKDK